LFCIVSNIVKKGLWTSAIISLLISDLVVLVVFSKYKEKCRISHFVRRPYFAREKVPKNLPAA
jgi:hypothetical protein